MANQLDIINLALARINAGRLVSIREESKNAQVAKLLWDTALDATLRSHDWGFAARREPLSRLADAPLGAAFAYAVPADSVAIRRIHAPDAGPEEQGAYYEIKHFAGQTAILCDIHQAVADYTARIADCTRFDPQFVDALAWRLARDFALALKSDAELASAAVQLQDRDAANASTANAKESGFLDDAVSSFERARWS